MDVLRPRGEGRLLPLWADTRHAEAQRGTRHLKTIDPNLVVALDTRRHVFQVWGPSIAMRGWTPIVDCQDDFGNYYRGAVPWPLICQALINAREGEFSCDRVQRENDEQEAREAAQWDAYTREAARFYRPAVQGEVRGYGRHHAQDLDVAFRAAAEGNSKRTAEERGQVTSLPGRAIG